MKARVVIRQEHNDATLRRLARTFRAETREAVIRVAKWYEVPESVVREAVKRYGVGRISP